MSQATMFEDQTVDDARAEFFEHIKDKDGTLCPVCDRNGQMFKRHMNRGMALTLIWLYQNTRSEFVHLSKKAPRHILTDNQVGKLARFWGFAAAKPNDDDPKKLRSGWYRITEQGVAFIEGRIRANAFCLEYHKEVYAWSPGTVSMSDALRKPFDYRELSVE